MDRRNFLQGVFGGITAAGLLVTAGPSEIAAYASGLTLDAPLLVDKPASPKKPAVVSWGEHLYNAKGELVAIVTAVNFSQETIDVTSFHTDRSTYVPGLRHIELTAECVGAASIEHGQLQLRGR